VVRAGLDAFERRDFERALGLVHPAIVSFRAPPLPDAQTYHGPEGVLQMYADWTADFGEFEMDYEEPIDAGDRVVVPVIQRARGRASGAPVAGTFWFVFTLAGGLITRYDVYASREQALEAAGAPDAAT
jgi:ketosteroid isomerase-like protein